MTHLEKLGKRLREIRIKRGLTLREVADVLLCDVSNLSKVERGLFDISTENLVILSKFYNVSPSYLLGMTEKETNIDDKLNEFDKWRLFINYCKRNRLDPEEALRILNNNK
ncbi:helix-turn-helix domain-containing protein [Metabacillus arenae]|uniref:Helix-turn-helix transcriptional regulator n=1 Tax=Metabacillus arenae TaxID=2771434 RepID=A0A926NE32_9BACI|nr:helix-turn-helix transcriptional regulator [Metabacillus arenae]MBD1379140.1 helix-turn-helix transcriptional regulator [Metabacillus arenae]